MSNNDVSETEAEALQEGGARGGAYLDSIGKTDLATLSGPEWSTFLAHVLCGYSERIRELCAAEPPF